MQTIIINVTGKVATAEGSPFIVCGNSDYIIKFNFDDAWAAYITKTARFTYEHDGEPKYSEVVFTGNQCNVPVILDTKKVEIGVYAGDILSTTRCKITCKPSILDGGYTHDEPDEDVYNQLQEAVNETLTNMVTADGTVVSPNADFAEVAEWADGNPDNEDRTGYFVCANVPVNGIIMRKATSVDDVKGVSILAPAFAGNYSKDKLDSNGRLLPKYSYVAIIGFVPVIDNGTCTVGGRCMPDDNGCAIPSSNSMGYQVINRIDENRVLIIIEPNGDMVQRIKNKINDIQKDIDNLTNTHPHEKYFEITEAGVISLKPEYRGAANKALTENDNTAIPAQALAAAISNNDVGNVGSKLYELPSEIVIPETVNGITVKAYERCIFAYNDRIKSIVHSPSITDIPLGFVYRAVNFEEIKNCENVKSVGQKAFSYTKVKRIEFPQFETKGAAKQAFYFATQLEYADIGKLTTIRGRMFQGCYNLREIKIENPVTTVEEMAFWDCRNLRTIEGVVASKATIGTDAFVKCRVSHPSASAIHNSNFWEGVSFTPCENRVISFLSQADLRWQTTEIYEGHTFYDGCEEFTIMGIWCSLNNVTVDDARDFFALCEKYDENLANIDGTFLSTTNTAKTKAADFCNAMGLTYNQIEFENFGASQLTQIYNAIASGKYVVLLVPNEAPTTDTNGVIDYSAHYGHVVAITGITPLGELIFQDPGDMGWFIGNREIIPGRAPIQNLIDTKNKTSGVAAVILGKAE